MTTNEIVLVAGPPGGGKSTYVKRLTAMGYTRINRDEIGGGLGKGSDSYQILWAEYEHGQRSFVLDNVYATRESRKVVLELAAKMKLPVHLLWLETTAEQAQFFAARRQVQRYGKILRAAEYKQHKGDPNMFPPAAQFAYWKKVERPEPSEGFAQIEFLPVKIDLGSEYVNKAVIFDFDDTLRRVPNPDDLYPHKPEDVIILPGRKEKLQALQAQGMILLGASNSSGCSREPGDPKYVSETDAIRCYDYTCEQLGVKIDYLFAPERGGVPQSYLRKPMPGMGVYFIEKYKLDPAQCIFVGDLKTDRTFADRCGFQFKLAEEFFHG